MWCEAPTASKVTGGGGGGGREGSPYPFTLQKCVFLQSLLTTNLEFEKSLSFWTLVVDATSPLPHQYALPTLKLSLNSAIYYLLWLSAELTF